MSQENSQAPGGPENSVEYLPPGALLASAPSMRDGNFMHSVVLLAKHSPNGAFGFVINHDSGMGSRALVQDHPLLSAVDFPVRHGGPVGLDQLQFLHRVPELLPGGVQVAEDLFLGGDLAALPSGTDPALLRPDLRLYLGHSGWGPGQLNDELEAGGWLPIEPRPQVVFEAGEREPTWRRVLRALGDGGFELSQQPPDPSWN